MHMLRITPMILANAVLSGALTAQDLFIASGNAPRLVRARDLDGNGSANDFGEFTTAAFSTTSLKQGYEVRAASLFGAPGVLFLDNDPSRRSLVKCVDANGNGVFEPSEISDVVASFTSAIGASGPDAVFVGGLAEASGGVAYVTSDQLAATPFPWSGIYRVSGLPGAAVVSAAIKTPDVVTIYDDDVTPTAATVAAGAWERIAWIASTQTLLAYNVHDDVIYALRDLDADGRFVSAGECVNWLNAANHKPGIATSADFWGGPLSAYGAVFQAAIPGPANFGNWFTFHYIEPDPITGAVFVGSRRHTLPVGVTEPVGGKVFRCVDLDCDGSCNGPGETTLYVSDQTP